MNAIQILNRVNFYNDVTRNARFTFAQVSAAVNDAMQIFINETMGDKAQRNPENFQFTQRIRDDLKNLITVAPIATTTTQVLSNKFYTYTESHINTPANYYDLIAINCNIDGYVVYARPTTYNEIDIILRDSFKHPTNEKVYYNEDSTGFKIYRGVGGSVANTILEYIRFAATFSLGQESDLINQGVGVLVVGVTYVAVEVSVHAGNSYQVGDTFVASNTTLTSGQVIPSSVLVTVDLPDKVHETICQQASQILLGVTANYNQSAFSEKVVSQGNG